MGEDLTAARRLPLQAFAKSFRVDGEQNEIGLSGEVFGERAFQLFGRGRNG